MLADTQRVLSVFQAMAAQHGMIDVWQPLPKTEELVTDDGLGELSDHPF